MKYCVVDGLRYPDEISNCRACGVALVDFSTIDSSHPDVIFKVALLCCPAPHCVELVAPAQTKFCAQCGGSLKPISYELWIDKFVMPALETRLAEVVLDPSDLFPPVAQLGLARSEASTRLDSLLAERTGVKRQVLESWTQKTVSLLKDTSQRETAMREAIRESKTLKIALAHATAILEVLNQRIEPPSESLESPVESCLEAKPKTGEPDSLKASAKSFYRRLVAGGSVTSNLTYLDFKKSASREGLKNTDEILKEVSSKGAFVLFVCGDNKGWVFPNPKLTFDPDSLNPLFATLTADQYDNFKEHIEPVPVIQVGRDRWQVATKHQSHDNQNDSAAATEPKLHQPEEAAIVFPVSAAECLAKTASSAKVVRHDVVRNLLVPGPDGMGELALVHIATVSKKGGTLFVAPRITRFNSADTFHNLYKEYYECARPSAGEVWIVEPAVVAKIPGGWRLRERGKLEIDFVIKESPVRDPQPKVLDVKQDEVSKTAPDVVSKEGAIARPRVEWRLRLAIGVIASLVLVAAMIVAIRRGPDPLVENRNASQTPTPTNMIRIPGGEFQMGNDAGDEYEKPAHKAAVKPFLMDANEVTCEEYLMFVKAKNHRAPTNWIGGKYPTGAAKKPVTGIDWDDATAYASWANKRLPTEAEWEFAARGTDGRRYPWGNDWQRGAANADGASRGLADVGSYKNGASILKTYDMIGNAWEWTATPLLPYPGGHLPPQPAGELKVIRGGSWQSDRASATTTYRWGWPARGGNDYNNTGFRCVKDIPPESEK